MFGAASMPGAAGPNPSPTGGAQPGGVPWWMKLLAPQMPGMGAMDPQQQKAMAQQNMLQMGLGMMAAGGPQKGPGMGFGQGLMQAYGGTMGNYQQLMQQAYQNQIRKSAMEQAKEQGQLDRELERDLAKQREAREQRRFDYRQAEEERRWQAQQERWRQQDQMFEQQQTSRIVDFEPAEDGGMYAIREDGTRAKYIPPGVGALFDPQRATATGDDDSVIAQADLASSGGANRPSPSPSAPPPAPATPPPPAPATPPPSAPAAASPPVAALGQPSAGNWRHQVPAGLGGGAGPVAPSSMQGDIESVKRWWEQYMRLARGMTGDN